MIFYNIKKVLAIFAHPDDAELSCFGTLAALKERGAQISLVIVSGGEKGRHFYEEGQNELAAARQSETTKSLEPLLPSISFLNFPDGEITVNNKLISALEKQISLIAPDLIITHHFDTSGIDHQDHITIAQAVKNICFRRADVKSLISVEPLKPYNSFSPNLFVDISKYFQLKMNSLQEHKSQKARNYFKDGFHRAKTSRWIDISDNENTQFETFRIEKHVMFETR